MEKFIDLTGQRFGRWLVLERDLDHVSSKMRREIKWKCRCDCGIERAVMGRSLTHNKSKSCGCYHKERMHELFFEDLTGQRFGRLIVLGLNSYTQKGRRITLWNCICDCGGNTISQASSLKNGNSKSCGCYNKEQSSKKHRLEFGESSINLLYGRYKSGAKNRGLAFDLTKELFKKITSENCYYCGREPFQVMKSTCSNGDYIYNGIDRIDSLEGYTSNNVVTSCGQCNVAKMDMAQSDFIDWIELVHNNLIKNNLVREG